MGRVLSTILMVFWGLWFGGNIALFLFVSSLFRQNRSLAIDAAPVLFITFERYHLLLAGASVVLSGAWLARDRSRATTALFVLLILGGLAAAGSAAFITPRIMQLRHLHQTDTAEFKRMHGLSMMIYSGEAVVLLIAGVVLSAVMRRQSIAAAPAVRISPPADM